MYYTYVLFSKSIIKYYVGQTIDINKRLEEHNRGKTKFMKTGIPWCIEYYETFKTRAEAVRLENKIKKRGAARFLEDLNTAG